MYFVLFKFWTEASNQLSNVANENKWESGSNKFLEKKKKEENDDR